MSGEIEERITFRFTRSEIAALAKLMGFGGYPELDVGAEAPGTNTAASLVESGFVMLCGDRTYVDRTISLVLAEAARSIDCAGARMGALRVALYRGERLSVVTRRDGELVTLEPLPDFAQAKACFLGMCEEWGAQQIRFSRRTTGASLEQAGDMKALRALVDAM